MSRSRRNRTLTHRLLWQFLLPVLLLSLYSPLEAQIRVVDDLQRIIVLSAPARRIVSLAPSITETLFALDAGEQIASVTDYCNYPAAAQTKPRVGGVINPSIEAVIGLKPDLVVMSVEGNLRRDFDKLVELGLNVFVSNPRSLEGIFASIEHLGLLTGRADTAQRLVQQLRRRASEIRARTIGVPRPSVLLFVSLQPIIVVGSGTFIAELLELAGGKNTAAGAASSFPTYSREAVLKDDPDVVIFLSDVLHDGTESLQRYPEWSRLKAFRTNTVFRIDADIVSRPGPRAVDALEVLFRFLHSSAQTQHGKP